MVPASGAANILQPDEKDTALLGLHESEFEGVLETKDGRYFREVNGEYVLQERQELSFASASDMNTLAGNDQLPIEIRESIQRCYEYACSLGIEDEITVTV